MMQRLIIEHKLRRTQSLDGIWQLSPQDGSGKVYRAGVPGVWERIPALTKFRGTAVYTRTVQVEESGHLLLKIGGASHTADVCWDGVQVGHHYNAYTGFEMLLPDVAAGVHTLTVTVDNSWCEASALHVPNDYYTYGGINRPVELHVVGAAFIDRMAFHSVKTGEGAYDACVKVYVQAVTDVAAAEVTVSVAGQGVKGVIGAIMAGETAVIDLCVPVTGVDAWDVLDPHLYMLTAELALDGCVCDDLIDRVGFRAVKVEGERILINDKPLQIKGFNRHEDHGQMGVSLSPEVMLDDLQLVLETGANSIRTCHYPNDPRFLDLCDELGILVWEENHARALPEPVFHSPLFAEQCRQCNEEMIAQHVNHPAIYVWGLLNECESETAFGRNVYAAQIAQLRALDPTRPITFASCRHYTDVCLDLVDIVSFNIYPRWYVNESVKGYTDKLVTWLETAGAANKPIIISEVGAGGIAGYHDPFGRAKWSEECQADIIAEQLTALQGNPRLSGTYLWQFADVRVADEWAMRRPKSQNNKGIVDMYRRPKLCFAVVKEIYSKK